MDMQEFESMPASCFVFIHASPGDRVGMVTRGISGCLITNVDQKDMTDAEAKKVVLVLNAHNGVEPEVADRMLTAAMSGWRCQRRGHEEDLAA